MNKIPRIYLLSIIIVITSCRSVSSTSGISVDRIEIKPPETRELTICLGYEPESLYPYRASSQAAQEVLQAVYDGPIDILNDGQVEPIILKRMPSLTDGSAFLTPVSV
ncbi:MAG: hypothetical protein Q7J07_07365, partial [Pelolinea sp.]|nr:hypothetical protein [Pelolinea sp.]